MCHDRDPECCRTLLFVISSLAGNVSCGNRCDSGLGRRELLTLHDGHVRYARPVDDLGRGKDAQCETLRNKILVGEPS